MLRCARNDENLPFDFDEFEQFACRAANGGGATVGVKGAIADDGRRDPVERQIDTLNPLKIAFAEWAAMLRDLRQSRSFSEVAGYLLGPPGWRPGGTGPTGSASSSSRPVSPDCNCL